MAEDLTKGLHCLLLPRFSELEARIGCLEGGHHDLSCNLELKESRAEVDALRQHVTEQVGQVSNIIGLVKDKLGHLDGLRCQELKVMQGELEQKASSANLHLLREHLQQATVALASKSDVARLEQLARQVDTLSDEVSRLATCERVDSLGRQVGGLSEMVSRKVDPTVTDALRDGLKGLGAAVAEKAEQVDLQEVTFRVHALVEDCARKAEMAKLEHVVRQLDAVEIDVQRKADDSRVEHLKRAVDGQADDLQQKAHNAAVEHAIRQIHALAEAMAQKASCEQQSATGDILQRVSDRVAEQYEDARKMAQGLADVQHRVDLDGAKLKNLCMTVGAGAGTWDAAQAPPLPGVLPV